MLVIAVVANKLWRVLVYFYEMLHIICRKWLIYPIKWMCGIHLWIFVDIHGIMLFVDIFMLFCYEFWHILGYLNFLRMKLLKFADFCVNLLYLIRKYPQRTSTFTFNNPKTHFPNKFHRYPIIEPENCWPDTELICMHIPHAIDDVTWISIISNMHKTYSILSINSIFYGRKIFNLLNKKYQK